MSRWGRGAVAACFEEKQGAKMLHRLVGGQTRRAGGRLTFKSIQPKCRTAVLGLQVVQQEVSEQSSWHDLATSWFAALCFHSSMISLLFRLSPLTARDSKVSALL